MPEIRIKLEGFSKMDKETVKCIKEQISFDEEGLGFNYISLLAVWLSKNIDALFPKFK